MLTVRSKEDLKDLRLFAEASERARWEMCQRIVFSEKELKDQQAQLVRYNIPISSYSAIFLSCILLSRAHLANSSCELVALSSCFSGTNSLLNLICRSASFDVGVGNLL